MYRLRRAVKRIALGNDHLHTQAAGFATDIKLQPCHIMEAFYVIPLRSRRSILANQVVYAAEYHDAFLSSLLGG